MLLIIVSQIKILTCDLSALRRHGFRLVFVGVPEVCNALPKNNLSIIEKVYPLASINTDTLSPIVKNYVNEVGAAALHILSAGEASLRVVAKVRDHFNIVGNSEEEIVPFLDKVIMKDKVSECGVRIPKHISFDKAAYQKDKTAYLKEIENQLPYPMFIKPIELYGAASARKLNNRDELIEAAESMLNMKLEYEIDEYISGVLCHCNCLIVDGEIQFQEFEEYTVPCSWFDEGYILGGIPLREEDPRWQRLDRMNREVIACLKAPNGATHCEIFITDKDELIFLEIASRPPGAMVPDVIEKMTGMQIDLEHIKARLGIPIQVPKKQIDEYYMWAYIPKKAGQVKALLEPDLKSEYEITWNIKVGDQCAVEEDEEAAIVFQSSSRAGRILIHNKDYGQLYEDFLKLRTMTLVITD